MGKAAIRSTPVYVFGDFAFVQVMRGVWIRSHVAIAFVACPTCKAVIKRPCVGRQGITAAACYMRRKAFKAMDRVVVGETLVLK